MVAVRAGDWLGRRAGPLGKLGRLAVGAVPPCLPVGGDRFGGEVYRNVFKLEFSPETFWVSAVSPEFN